MTSNGGKDGEFQLVSHVKEEYKGDANVVIGNEPGLGRYDELQIGKVSGNLKVGEDRVLQRSSISQAPQPQQVPQGSQIEWERFLHVGSIKVLLVENDDSTRHVVTALLRNCNYEVVEAANGFQAWKILEDPSNHIDIVLTEVVMPSFSGIGLLCKIMSHTTHKNTPVIMMSSHDSMGLVFKCLSKGAADFLLKPIRKNELKILWQHVWRRCHSSSGSGSESGTNAQKSVNSKRSDDSINIIGDGIGSTPDGSDDGSSTQSSWTKQTVELESPQAASPCDGINEHPDSTCGLVIHSAEIPATRDFQEQERREDNVGKGEELAIGRSKDREIQTAIHIGKEQNIPQDVNPTQDVRDDIDMCGPQLVNGEFESQQELKNILDTGAKVMDDSRETVTELSLKRPREVKDVLKSHNVLRHSELSAFTRYNTTSNAIRTGITSSSSQLDNRSDSMKKESTREAHSDGYLIHQGSNKQKSSEVPPSDLLDPPQVHRYHNVEPKQRQDNHEDLRLKELAASAPRCGSSSNVFGGGIDGNVENYSLNRSASGSKHGSNGQNGSSNAVNLEGKNVESDGALAGKSGSGGASGNGSGGSENKIGLHKSAQREAALMKFREKRKDRCFQKKVRYQNKKRLAEQRPRV